MSQQQKTYGTAQLKEGSKAIRGLGRWKAHWVPDKFERINVLKNSEKNSGYSFSRDRDKGRDLVDKSTYVGKVLVEFASCSHLSKGGVRSGI